MLFLYGAIKSMTHAQVMNIVVTKTFAAIKEILPFEFNAFLSQLAEASA